MKVKMQKIGMVLLEEGVSELGERLSVLPGWFNRACVQQFPKQSELCRNR